MPAKNGLQLIDGDLEIMHHVHELRLAHIGHLAALTGRSEKALSRRLLKLQENAYLKSITSRPQKYLYTVGSEGLAALVETGFAPDDVLARRPRESELKPLWLKHFLLVVDVHVKLILAARTSTIRLIQWKEGKALWDRVTFVAQGREVTIPVRPDAFFALRDTARPEGKNTLYCFLEADRSTMSHERMATKITGYVQYFQQGLHMRKHPGVKLFQVLTVTETASRARSLAANLQPAIPRGAERRYPFLSLADLSLVALLPAPVAGAGER